MIEENLGLLLKLYRRPRAAMGDIMDGASLLFAAAAVLAISVLLAVGTVRAVTRPAAEGGTVEAAEGEQGGDAQPLPPGALGGLLVLSAATSQLTTVFALALLYVPATLLLVTLVQPVGSFGVAFRRDYGSLLACTLMAWAAAHLPFALAGLALGAAAPATRGPLTALLLWAAGTLYFGVLMVQAIRTVFGARLGPAFLVVSLSWISLLLQPYLVLAASPFVLFWGYQLLHRDLGDVTFSLGARQGFKRHLEAATLNPRDAGAHYQLGLIHQQRGQDEEAVARFLKAVEIDPGEVDAHYQLGRIARRQQRLPDAIAHFEQVVSRDPAHGRHEVWREIGATYLDSAEAAHARWALERFVERRPHDPEGLYHLGRALRALGDEDGARSCFERCLEAADTMPRYRRHEVRPWRKLARQALAERR